MTRIPVSPPPLKDFLDSFSALDILELSIKGRLTDEKGRYLHWDDLRHRTPPEGMTLERWWGSIRLARQASGKKLPFRDAAGRPFTFNLTDHANLLLHRLDRALAEPLGDAAPDADERTNYIVQALFEEAITSSQIEGAATTRDVAKKMLGEGREPRNKSERMIFNNYRALEFIREHCGEPLTASMVFELHRIVTDGTLDDPSKAGVFRLGTDDIVVNDPMDGTLLHRPPPVQSLPARLARLTAFANEQDGETFFLHPMVRAILLHFMLAYDHPFVDGNGRTARALFYWCAMNRGYRLMEYLSISEVIHRARAKYDRAFLFVETDENDVTYFIVHQLATIETAWRRLEERVRRRQRESGNVSLLLDKVAQEINHRQRSVLAHAARHPGYIYTVVEHSRMHMTSVNTARADLQELADLGFLDAGRKGRKAIFIAPHDFAQRLGPVR